MNPIIMTIQIVIPIVAAFLLIYGIFSKKYSFVSAALWISLIAIVLHYQLAGGEILGNYFNYIHASVYTLSFLVLVISVIYFIPHLQIKKTRLKVLGSLFQAILVVASVIVILNVWINAVFIENKKNGVPIMKVVKFKTVPYCKHKVLFYKINKEGKAQYLCPNYYSFIPIIGTLDTLPDFINQHITITDMKSKNNKKLKKKN